MQRGTTPAPLRNKDVKSQGGGQDRLCKGLSRLWASSTTGAGVDRLAEGYLDQINSPGRELTVPDVRILNHEPRNLPSLLEPARAVPVVGGLGRTRYVSRRGNSAGDARDIYMYKSTTFWCHEGDIGPGGR